MKELEREREREREESLKLLSLKLFEDTTATERHYSRSIKIRFAAMDWMRKLAEATDRGKPQAYESLEDLGADCALWVHRGGWDRKPGGTEAGTRWAKEYMRPAGYFASDSIDGAPGVFTIAWRDGFARSEVEAMLSRQKRRRR